MSYETRLKLSPRNSFRYRNFRRPSKEATRRMRNHAEKSRGILLKWLSPRKNPQAIALDVLNRYYAALNAEDRPGLLTLLTEEVAHETNQESRETGRTAFAAF